MSSRSPSSVSPQRSYVSFPLQELSALGPFDSDLVQVNLAHPFIANPEPIHPSVFGPAILPTGFPRVPLPEPSPRCFIDPLHYQMHSCLKIDGRVRAQNSRASPLISVAPTIIIGLGVSHAPGNPDGPSIAAVVHSRTWPEISEYRAYSCTKPPKVDMMDSLYKPVPGDDGETKDAGIMREVLQDFEESTGIRNPERIIIFRYGVSVSESHLARVSEAELDQISEACKFFDNEWSPKFAVIRFLVLDSVENPGEFFDDIRCISKIDDSVPAKVVVDQIGLSPDEVAVLGESLSYVNEMRAQAISLIAPVCGPPENPKLEEPEAKRVEARKELNEDELKRYGSEREYINDDDELALYVLGRLNAEKGGKYTLEKFLHRGKGTFWKKSFDEAKKWSHVSMYAQEWNGENVCRKIIFGELGYSDGKYEPVNVTVLDPNKPEEIKYGCGFCFGGYAGEQKNPHPADPSAYTTGHWRYSLGPWIHMYAIPDTPHPYSCWFVIPDPLFSLY